MNPQEMIKQATQLVKSNSPEILTALGVSGVVTTAYLTGKASYKASVIITHNEKVDPPSTDRKERLKERVKHTWRLYVPAAISGAVTITCIIASNKTNGTRTAAAVTAYSLTEKAFTEYKDKVAEQIGVGKEQGVKDEIAQDRVLANPAPAHVLTTEHGGDVLCCELYTMRYFQSSMETLRSAQNSVNHWVVHQGRSSLSDFYDLLGLKPTCVSNDLGWEDEMLLNLEFSSVLTDSGQPVLAFRYNYVKPLE